jgi:membrane glycosyltransferase
MIFIAGWALLVAWRAPAALLWLAPVFVGPLVAIPLAYFTALPAAGNRAARRGWFLIPEETQPPPEIEAVQKEFSGPITPFFNAQNYAADYGLLQAILDPYVNGVHV